MNKSPFVSTDGLLNKCMNPTCPGMWILQIVSIDGLPCHVCGLDINKINMVDQLDFKIENLGALNAE